MRCRTTVCRRTHIHAKLERKNCITRNRERVYCSIQTAAGEKCDDDGNADDDDNDNNDDNNDDDDVDDDEDDDDDDDNGDDDDGEMMMVMMMTITAAALMLVKQCPFAVDMNDDGGNFPLSEKIHN